MINRLEILDAIITHLKYLIRDIQPSLVGVLKENGIHPKDAIISWYQPDEENTQENDC